VRRQLNLASRLRLHESADWRRPGFLVCATPALNIQAKPTVKRPASRLRGAALTTISTSRPKRGYISRYLLLNWPILPHFPLLGSSAVVKQQ
jgi:hypothetical protein